jgi:replicative DNA helicase
MKNDAMSDIESESYVLGAILSDNVSQKIALDELSIDDFYHVQHKRIFESFKIIHKAKLPVNTITVIKTLKDIGYLEESGGIVYVENLKDFFSNIDIEFYIRIIKSCSFRRKLISLAHNLAKNALDTSYKPEDLIDRYSKDIASIGSYSLDKFDDIRFVSENYKNGLDFLSVLKDECYRVSLGENIFDGVRSYFPRLDDLIGGFANGSNTIIGARSSSGKTTFLSNLFLNIHENAPHIRMGFFSLEMKKSRILEKIICSDAGVSFKKLQERLLNPLECEKIYNSANRVKKMNLTIFDRSGININEFKSHIRRESIRNKLDIVFLDYLTLVLPFSKTGNKHQEVDQISKAIQSIALELNIPLVSLSQLNRQIYGRTEKTPVLSDLRESGSIEEDADLVMLLHRPAHYDKTKQDFTQVIVAKSRLRGDLGMIQYEYDNGRYKELSDIKDLLPGETISGSEKPEKQEYIPSNWSKQ